MHFLQGKHLTLNSHKENSGLTVCFEHKKKNKKKAAVVWSEKNKMFVHLDGWTQPANKDVGQFSCALGFNKEDGS